MTKKNEQGVCPECGSRNLEYEEDILTEGVRLIGYAFTCLDCGAEGKELFMVVYQNSIILHDEGEVEGDYPPTEDKGLCITDYSNFQDVIDNLT
jgi:hypothetical protein